ncbi:MAG: RraA family protein [Alphaproteobacteria bacterium]|nr:MAG: RraA family protein [Alphaproteobacteria bacterium]
MAIQRYETTFSRLPADILDRWRAIPPAVASDCMNRQQFMTAAIKPLAPGLRLTGQARTVTSMVGDNGVSHVATALLQPGDVLVVDAGGYEDVAVWGGVATRAAIARGAAGVVIDGAVRDVAEIRALGFACFARAVVPGGPHKGFGGTIDGAIACGGCPVEPGDIVLGDDDGVVVVPLARHEEVLGACVAKLEQEEDWLREIAAGRTMADILALPDPELLDG